MKNIQKIIMRTKRSDGRFCFYPAVYVFIALMLMLAAGCAFTGAPGRQAGEPNANLLVARTDFDVSAEWNLPVVMGREFWNMLGHKSDKWETKKQYQKHINTEPMIYESAVIYSLSGKGLSATNNPLEVGVRNLLGIEDKSGPLVTNVPFIVTGLSARPPFVRMMPYRPDFAAYKRWKEQHPNFMGFQAGTEWDNEYNMFLMCADDRNIENVQKTFEKRGYSEADIAKSMAKLRKIVAKSKEGRRQAVEGLKASYDALRGYCFSDDAKMLFMRGGWCYDHYPLEWGAGGIIMETTNTGAYRHQVSMFFARGAARQYRKCWTWFIATFLSGYDSKGKGHSWSCPYYTMVSNSLPPPNDYLGKDYGMSTSLNRRDMYLGYLNGASFVAHETWPYAYCQLSVSNKPAWDETQIWTLSPHGEVMKEWYGFTMRHPDRGISYAPVALAVPFSQGYPQWGGQPFTTFPMVRGDTMIDAFMYTLVPFNQDTKKGQEGCLANSPYGDIYDVLVLDPPSGPAKLDVLDNYKVLILLGKYAFDRQTVKRLEAYVSGGGTLVVNIEQVNNLFGEKFTGLARSGKNGEVRGVVRSRLSGCKMETSEPYDYAAVTLRGGRVLWEDESGAPLAAINRYGKGNVVTTMIDWMVPRAKLTEDDGKWGLNRLYRGDEMPFVKLLMTEIVDEVLPVKIEGDIEYGLNKTKTGWLVYLINNRGVTKWTDTREILDGQASAKVVIDCGKIGKISKVTELRSDKDVPHDAAKQQFEVNVGPGDIKVLSIRE